MTKKGLLQSLGPGLIWAAAAIGVSHLVQSTRAGAVFGFSIIWVVLLANFLKYPFFEFGPRYAAATGESLLDGYKRLGRIPVLIYTIVTVGTMFTIMAAVTIVTGSIATQIFSEALSPFQYSVILLSLSIILLIPGKYPMLDRMVKIIIVILTLSTISAVIAALIKAPVIIKPDIAPALFTLSGVSFLIALTGWMPSAIDISVWHSMWTIERAKQTGHKPLLKEALADFNIGYIGTSVIAIFFLALGSLIMFGSGETFAATGGGFAKQLITLYTNVLGEWSKPIILLAAFTTMMSTTFTCTDAFSRVLQKLSVIYVPDLGQKTVKKLYWFWMIVVVSGSLILLSVLKNQLTLMVDIATTLSFITAPVLGYLNLKVVTSGHMPLDSLPPIWIRVLSWFGIGFGAIIATVFIAWRFVSI